MVTQPSTQELLLTAMLLRIQVSELTMTGQAQLMKYKHNHLMFMWQLATKSTLLGTGRNKHT